MINRSKIMEIANQFDDICIKNNVWYSLDAMTLLGAVKHGGFVPWSERFDVMILPEGYSKLLRLFPNNFIDSFIDDDLKGFQIYFVHNFKDWKDEQPFVRIRIAIPSTNAQIKRFHSLHRILWNRITLKVNNIKTAIDELENYKFFEGYYLPVDKKTKSADSWIQVLSKKTVDKDFSGQTFKVSKEYDLILKRWYGAKYRNISHVPTSWKEYYSPSIVKVFK